jgi:hypothetical protein
MRIRFESDGGFVYLPGLNRPFAVDTADLPPATAAELEALVHQARASASGGPPSGADQRSYRITIDSGGGSQTMIFTDPVSDPAAQALIDRLTELKNLESS